jgi:hypothetical protein
VLQQQRTLCATHHDTGQSAKPLRHAPARCATAVSAQAMPCLTCTPARRVRAAHWG